MKAIRIDRHGGPEVLQLQQQPEPRPGPGEILVRIKATAVNPADIYQREGIYGYSAEFPFTPGMEGAGVVEAVGPEVSHVKPGQAVYCLGSLTGTYAEAALVTAYQTVPLPHGVSFEQGACIFVSYTTAHLALFGRGNAKSGETVLIHGASGGVGLAATQLASHAGLNVIGTARTHEGRELIQAQGAALATNHQDTDAIMEYTQGRGVDLIVEMLAGQNLAMDLELLSRSGRVMVVGSRQSAAIDPRALMQNNADIRGIMLLHMPLSAMLDVQEKLRSFFEQTPFKPVIAETFPMEQAAQAQKKVMRGPAHGRIVLRNL